MAVPNLTELSDHVVILNVNEKVGRIVEEIVLGSAGEPPRIVVVIQDRELWTSHPEWYPRPEVAEHVVVVDGCPAEPTDLAAVGIGRARAAVILADPRQGQLADALSTLVAVAIERRSPQVHTVMELIASVNRVHLRSTEVNEVVCLGELAEHLIAQSCITPGIANVFADLLHAHPGTTQVFLCELPDGLVGLTYRQIARRALEVGAPFTVCGFARDGEKGATFTLNPRAAARPGKDTTLGAADRLVVVAYSKPELGRLKVEG